MLTSFCCNHFLRLKNPENFNKNKEALFFTSWSQAYESRLSSFVTDMESKLRLALFHDILWLTHMLAVCALLELNNNNATAFRRNGT